MRPTLSLTSFLGILFASSAASALPAPGATESTGTGVLGVRCVDLDGVPQQIGQLEVGGRLAPTVLVFLDTECPISNRYAPRLGELAEEAGAAGVAFYGVLSDPGLGGAEARAYRDEYGLAFPILFDSVGDLATRLAPTHVPEAFVLDDRDEVVYRGRIDDRFVSVGRLRASITSHDLEEAIQAVSSEARPDVRRTDPIGCVFEAWSAWSGGPVADELSYARHVAPILAANCVECHRDGDIGPFDLTDYKGSKRRARMIAQVCEERVMPPWQAAPGYGHFRDERVLSQRQIDVLRAWADGGAPEGVASDALPSAPTPESRWRLGEPDFVVSMPIDYEVPASGDDIYRYFAVPSELLEDKVVVAVDFRPGNPEVVHHCLAYLDTDGAAVRMDESTPGPGFSLFGNGADYEGSESAAFLNGGAIAGWAPGAQPRRQEPGLGWKLPHGVDFVLEVHYHLNGKPATDKSELAFYFADEPVERYVEALVIGTEQIDIEPEDDAYGRYVWMEVPADIELLDVTPHMHYLGREVEAFATRPDGSVEPLIHIPRWDFRWQDTYTYRQPVKIPAGSRIEAFFQYDNSSANPFNPTSPPGRVLEGWQTTDEMCLFYFSIIPADPSAMGELRSASIQSFVRPSNP